MSTLNFLLIFLIHSAVAADAGLAEDGKYKEFEVKLQYPYFASHEKIENLLSGLKKIVPGMNRGEAVVILGEPDKASRAYRSIKKGAPPIGYREWYYLKKNQPEGSEADKAVWVVVVDYHLNLTVKEIMVWGEP